jgi:hypothetical protein
MSGPPLGFEDDLLWDITLVHHTCDLQRTDVLLRASHVLGDGQRFVTNLQAVMQPGTKVTEQQQQQQRAGRQERLPVAKMPPGALGAQGKQQEEQGCSKLAAEAGAPAAEGDVHDLIKAVPSGGSAAEALASSQQQQQQQQQGTSSTVRQRKGSQVCSSAPASCTQQQGPPDQMAQPRGQKKSSSRGRAQHRLAQLVSLVVAWLLVVARWARTYARCSSVCCCWWGSTCPSVCLAHLLATRTSQ